MDDALTVLLVDDDRPFSTRLNEALAHDEEQFQLATANSLRTALAHIAHNTVDIILLNLALPDSSGLVTLPHVQHVAPETPIIVLSTHQNRQMARHVLRAGAQDFINKNETTPSRLVQTIITTVERHRVQAVYSQDVTRLGILRDVDEELTRRLDVDYVLTMSLDTAVRLSLASAGVIGLFVEDEALLTKSINYPAADHVKMSFLEEGIIGRALTQHKAQRVLDVSADPDYNPRLTQTRAQIALPLVSRDRVIGFLNLETTDPNRFTEEVFSFLKVLAGRIAAAVDNAYLYENSKMQLAELRVLYSQVQTLEQLKTDMLRIATHDLRGPLNNITQSAYLIRRVSNGQLPAEAHAYMDTINRSVSRMKTITEDILSLEKLEARKNLIYEQVDLQQLIEDAYQENRQQAQAKELSYSLTLADHPVEVRGEEVLLYEAVSNLINNAIKYTPSGGEVEVQVHCNSHNVHIQVVDTGIGIPEDQQARLFQPFYRAQSEAMQDIEGTGLGLHLVKNIVTRHHGEMVFTSTYGEGSTFGFSLPLTSSEVSD